MSVTVGTRLGPYEILGHLGAGGMGEVYRATDTVLKRQIALKVLPPEVVNDPERGARFQREAEVLASLNHPNIAHLYGLERSGGTLALVMELVEGPTLAHRIAQGAIPIDEALPIAKQIAEALEAAHEQGIIHRDLKPSNIKVREDGTVKVLDFGLAKAMEPVSIGRTAAVLTNSPTITSPALVTGVGVLLGTAAYMSPEQARGRSADRRADMWAFGCVLYEMLTAQRPFDGSDVADVLAAVVRAEPDWTKLPHETPPPLRTLLHRCLRKDPRQRIADAGSARLELEDVAHGSAATDRVPPHKHQGALWVWLVSAATFLVGAVGAWVLRGPGEARAERPVRFSFTIEDRALSTYSRHLFAVSPDGQRIVFSANGGLFTRSMSDLVPHLIPGSNVGSLTSDPTMSPDGQFVAFVVTADASVRRLPVAGGVPVPLTTLGFLPQGMTWSGDAIFASLGEGGIVRIPATGGPVTVVVKAESGEALTYPQHLPAANAMLFNVRRSALNRLNADAAPIVVESLTTHERRVLVDAGADPRVLPNGYLLYALGGVIYGVSFDTATATMHGVAAPLLEGVLRTSSGAAQFTVSPSGTVVYAPGPLALNGASFDVGLWSKDKTTPFGLPARPYFTPRVSPRTSEVAFHDDDERNANVWIYDPATRGAPRPLTLSGRNRFPVWSSDGRRVIFQSNREGDLGMWSQLTDGSKAADRLTHAPTGSAHVPESVSADGKTLLFRVEKGSTFTLSTYSFSDQRSTPLLRAGGAIPPDAVFSPDGRWFAYNSSDETTRPQVFVEPFPPTGSQYRVPVSLPGDNTTRHPVWGRSGNRLYYNSGPGLIADVQVDFRSGVTFGTPEIQPRPLGVITDYRLRNWDFMPDGKTIVTVLDLSRAQELPFQTNTVNVALDWLGELRTKVGGK
jgi:serine/threonine-protein kinase